MAVKLIVGLGNPGTEYTDTRHNLGFLAVDALAEQAGLRFKASRVCKGLVAAGQVNGVELHLLKPLTYMNNSGFAVRRFVEHHGIPLTDMLVLCDDFNLDSGTLRIRRRGSDGGHNGLASLIMQLESEDFARLRLGIGPLPPGADTVDFVLGEMTKKEKEVLPDICREAKECCLAWLTETMEQVMSQFNKRKENGKV